MQSTDEHGRDFAEERLVYQRLLDEAVKLMQGFDERITNVDAYTNDKLGIKDGDAEAAKDPEKLFLKQVVYGTYRYQQVLKVLVSSFYFNNGAKAARSDATKYTVLGYLALFRLDELTFPVFEQMARSQGAVKAHPLLAYIFDRQMMEKWVVEEWGKVLDMGFVKNTLLDRLQRHTPAAKKLIASLAAEAFGDVGGAAASATDSGNNSATQSPTQAQTTTKPKQSKKPLTVPEPFNLHKPSAAKLPEPVRIEAKIALQPVPQSTYRNTLSKLEQERQDRRDSIAKQTAAKYQPTDEFKLAESKVDIEALRAEARAREEVSAGHYCWFVRSCECVSASWFVCGCECGSECVCVC
jgi:hypothetical protein